MQEMGKSRAAAFAVGLQDIDEAAHVNELNDSLDEYENPLAEGNRFLKFRWLRFKLNTR